MKEKYVVFNPQNKPLDELPWIIGFNNGGSPGWFDAQLIAEDGTGLGGHLCSHEGFMEHDLGILEGSRSDRHETFKKHYPDGYRMDFVSYSEVSSDPRLTKAFELNKALAEKQDKNASYAKIEVTFSGK
jgi:hypothetical protein